MEKINIHTNEDTSLRKIGSIIKEARLSKNKSVNDLATNLKISEQQLKAIEEGRDDLLPEKVFVKAMIKKISEKSKEIMSLRRKIFPQSSIAIPRRRDLLFRPETISWSSRFAHRENSSPHRKSISIQLGMH